MRGTCFIQTNFRRKCKLIKGQFTALEKPNKYMKGKSILLLLMDLFSTSEGKGKGERGRRKGEVGRAKGEGSGRDAIYANAFYLFHSTLVYTHNFSNF